MKKYGMIICILTVGLVTVLNVNTYLSKIDKSYNLALNNIEALAQNSKDEDGGIATSRCAMRVSPSEWADSHYLECPSGTEGNKMYPCPSVPKEGAGNDTSYHCYY